MRHARLLVLLPALLATGCPGDWDEPLGPVRGGHIDAKLVGDWRCTAAEDDEPGRVSIRPFDKDQYVIVTSNLDGTGSRAYYRAYTTTVSGYDVMNVKELDSNPRDGQWMYMRFHHPEDGRLQVDLLTREPLDGVPDDVESRRQAIGDLYESPGLWHGGLRCVPYREGETGGEPPRAGL